MTCSRYGTAKLSPNPKTSSWGVAASKRGGGTNRSKLLESRIGVRNDNDLVWIGRAANYAAKLSNLSDEVAIRITHSVYDQMNECVKIGGVNKENMWEERTWTDMNGMKIYRSNWRFGV